MYNKIALSLCFTLLLGLLTACNPKGFLHLEKNESRQAEKLKNTKDSKKISAPIALPPSFNTQPLKPGQTETLYMPNGLPALKPMKGMNIETLFSESIKDPKDRFNRVENAVVDLRKEFDTYKPSIVRLAAVESDIQNLIKELEVLLQETPASQQPVNLMNHSDEVELQVQQLDPQPLNPPEIQKVAQVDQIKEKSTPIKTIPPPQKITKPPPNATQREESKSKNPLPQYNGVVARNLRIGEHADKVRIVLDSNKYTNFSIDLDNDEKLIIIELPDARWIGDPSKNIDSKLLESYSIEPLNNGKGAMIILSLKKATQIIQKKRLSPDNSSPYHRIYFDLEL